MKYKIREVADSRLGKYQGMNHEAAKELRFHPCPKPNEILVAKGLKPAEKKRTIAHEKIEAFNMRRGLKYRSADNIAESFDKRVRL